jgi:hypothetical protein
MYGRGGFPLVNQGFHPGFAGHGPYSGNGGGRYGARGWPAGWQSQARGGYGSQRGPVAGNSNNQSRGINFREVIENRAHQVAAGTSKDQQTLDRESSGVNAGWKAAQGAEFREIAGATGSVSVGGKSFNLSEQVAMLLQQAFEAMSRASSDPVKVLEEVQAKGK